MFKTRYCDAILIALLIPFHIAPAMALDEPPVEPLVESKLSVEPAVRQAWLRAIGNDQAARLNRLIRLHDPAALLRITASNGKSALMVAGKVGDLPLVTTLVSAGARIDETTQTNGTALMFRCRATSETLPSGWWHRALIFM